MKKTLLLLICSSFLSLIWAQLPTDAIPFDASVRTGTLENGMKYYIKKNVKPENRVELRLAVNAGSMMEDDDQQGLAHFCEHMAFNGTTHFKKNDLVNYLESIGTKFGPHLNAFTSFDETVYMLQLPTDKEEILDKGFQVLEDWASGLAFENEEIDKERGVVASERRLGLGADKRMFDKTFPVQMKGSRYAERLPIGKLEVLEKCSYETLKRFYKDWYRPDLMAVVIIGDIDVDKTEKIIKDRFAKIAKTKSPRPVKAHEVPDQDKPMAIVATDKEASYNKVELIFKHPVKAVKTLEDWRRTYIAALCNQMLQSRFEEYSQLPNPPLTYGYSGYSDLVRTKSAFNMIAITNDKNITLCLETLFKECESLRRFGFTTSELERARKVLLKQSEQSYADREKTESGNLVWKYVYHYLNNEPAPSIEDEYKFAQKTLPTLSLKDVNEMVQKWITDGKNMVVAVSAIEKETLRLPKEEDILKMYNNSKSLKLDPRPEEDLNMTLMKDKPKAGIISGIRTLPDVGVTVVVFENGAKVALKPTNFKNDEILFSGFSMGGSSLYGIEDDMTADMAAEIVTNSGLGNLSQTQLMQYLNGKDVAVSMYVGETNEGMQASQWANHCSVNDLETALQMLNLYFTAPKMDKSSMYSVIEKNKSFLENKYADPEGVFGDSIQCIMDNYHQRHRPVTARRLDTEINPERVLPIFKERFNASDFMFLMVGNFDIEKIKPLLATYIGSIPARPIAESFKDIGVTHPKGAITRTIKKGTEPKSTVHLEFKGGFEYNRQNRLQLQALMNLVSIKLREAIREDKGGAYGVQAYSYMTRLPKGEYTIVVEFGCDPKRVQELTDVAIAEIKKIQENGAEDNDITKVKELKKRELEVAFKENSFWIGNLTNNFLNGEDVSDFTSPDKIYAYISEMYAEDFQALAKKYFTWDNYATFVLVPEK